jgi:hypothetical protein
MGVDLLLVAEIDRLMDEVKLLRVRAIAAMSALQCQETDSSPTPATDSTSPPAKTDAPDP